MQFTYGAYREMLSGLWERGYAFQSYDLDVIQFWRDRDVHAGVRLYL